MKNSTLPLVSVIIPTFNRPRMLQRAIDSVLNQSYKKVEVVVVDDNNPNTESRKATEELMNSYKEFENVKYIKHAQNMNGAAARNTGIMKSEGEIICFLDDDDWYYQDKLKKQVDFLIENPEFDAVYCGWYRNNKEIIPIKEGNLLFEQLSGSNLIITNVIMMKKEAAIKCGGWDEKFKRNQEAVFLIRFFRSGYKIGVVREVLVGFDLSDRSNVSNPKKYEEDMDFFLKANKEIIEEFENKKIIYSYRYRSVLLNYVKNRNIFGAIKFFLRIIRLLPLRFPLDILVYIKRKAMRQSIF